MSSSTNYCQIWVRKLIISKCSQIWVRKVNVHNKWISSLICSCWWLACLGFNCWQFRAVCLRFSCEWSCCWWLACICRWILACPRKCFICALMKLHFKLLFQFGFQMRTIIKKPKHIDIMRTNMQKKPKLKERNRYKMFNMQTNLQQQNIRLHIIQLLKLVAKFTQSDIPDQLYYHRCRGSLINTSQIQVLNLHNPTYLISFTTIGVG